MNKANTFETFEVSCYRLISHPFRDWASVSLSKDTELFETMKQGYRIWPTVHNSVYNSYSYAFMFKISPNGELYAFRASLFEELIKE